MGIIRFINKWVMRVKEARTVLTVGLWGVMAMVQVIDFLRPYLSALQLVSVGFLMSLGGLAFTYLYDKLEIMKGEHVQRVRRKNNFVGENMMLQHMGMIYFLSEALEVERTELMKSYEEFLENYGEGVDNSGGTTVESL